MWWRTELLDDGSGNDGDEPEDDATRLVCMNWYVLMRTSVECVCNG